MPQIKVKNISTGRVGFDDLQIIGSSFHSGVKTKGPLQLDPSEEFILSDVFTSENIVQSDSLLQSFSAGRVEITIDAVPIANWTDLQPPSGTAVITGSVTLRPLVDVIVEEDISGTEYQEIPIGSCVSIEVTAIGENDVDFAIDDPEDTTTVPVRLAHRLLNESESVVFEASYPFHVSGKNSVWARAVAGASRLRIRKTSYVA